MVPSSPLIAPLAEFMPNPQEREISTPVVVYDSESDDDSEPSSSMDIESYSNKTTENPANTTTREEKIASLELRMKRALEKPNPWRCSICSNELRTLQDLQNHVKANHKYYDHKCYRCPYFSKHCVRRHERCHDKMDRKYKIRGGYKCELCHVWLVTASFAKHLRLYHGV